MAELRTKIVLRNDNTANWLTNESVVLLKGEVSIEFLPNGQAKMKIGDGETAWSALPYFGGEEAHVYEATVAKGGEHIAAILGVLDGAIPNAHDVAVVQEALISEDDLTDTLNESVEQKYQYTAYRYNGENWVAMDGNYSAENVYFTEDFTFTTKIGTVQNLTNGSTTVAAAGKNIKEFLAGLFAAEQNPGKTDPSVSVTLTGAGSYEVGSVVNPSYKSTFDDGSYTYGPEPTGAQATTWSVTSTANESWTTQDGTCDAVTVADNTNYSVTVQATHTAGAYGKTNLGNESNIQIAAGTKSKTSSAITGYRNVFYGSKTAAIDLTSANIRSLTAAKSSNSSVSVSVVEGARQVIIAVPSGRVVTKVADEGAFGTDIFSEFVKSTVSVGGADATADNIGGYAKDYNVYVYSPSTALGANTYTVTLANG